MTRKLWNNLTTTLEARGGGGGSNVLLYQVIILSEGVGLGDLGEYCEGGHRGQGTGDGRRDWAGSTISKVADHHEIRCVKFCNIVQS